MRDLLRLAVWIAWSCVACAVQPSSSYVHVAEGRSSETSDGPSEIAFRLLSAPDPLSTDAVASFVIEPDPLEVVAGEAWPLAHLRVVALDSEGKLVPRVPFSVELDQSTALLLDTGPLYESTEILIRSCAPPGQLRVRGRSEPSVSHSALVTVHVSAPRDPAGPARRCE